MADDKKKKDNKKKKDAKPSTSLRISHSSDSDKDGITITVHVAILSDRVENAKKRPVRFFNPSNMKTLTNGNKNSGSKGRTSLKIKIPRKKIRKIIDNDNGILKVGIEVTTQKGESSKLINKTLIKETEIVIKLPAGTIKKGYWTFRIRMLKHAKDFGSAIMFIGFSYIFIHLAGKGNINLFTGLLTATIVLLWWQRTKSITRTVLGLLLQVSIFYTIKYNPTAFTDPIFNGIYKSLLVGAPFYIFEELYRKSDGTSVKNFYPLWPAGMCLVYIFWLILKIFGGFVPKSTISMSSLNDPNAFLNANSNWNFLNNLPFMGNVNFSEMAGDFNNITEAFVIMLILVIYGGSRELFDWFKSFRSGAGADVSAGGFAGIFIVISELWNNIRDFIIPFLRGKGRRR